MNTQINKRDLKVAAKVNINDYLPDGIKVRNTTYNADATFRELLVSYAHEFIHFHPYNEGQHISHLVNAVRSIGKAQGFTVRDSFKKMCLNIHEQYIAQINNAADAEPVAPEESEYAK
jgi:hypothetical protein